MGRIRKFVANTKDRVKRIDYSGLYELGLGFWIFILFTFIFGLLFLVYIKTFINVFVNDYGYLGIMIMSFITDLLVQPAGPDVPLVIGIFSGLDPWAVLVMVLVGAYLAFLASYYIGRSLGAAGIEKIIGKRAFARLERYKMGPRWFMFIGALTPVPYIPYLAGLWQFSLKDNILFVLLPRTIRFVFVLLVARHLGITFF